MQGYIGRLADVNPEATGTSGEGNVVRVDSVRSLSSCCTWPSGYSVYSDVASVVRNTRNGIELTLESRNALLGSAEVSSR